MGFFAGVPAVLEAADAAVPRYGIEDEGFVGFGLVTAGVEVLRAAPLVGLEGGAPSFRWALTCVFSMVPEALRLSALFSDAPFTGVAGREVGFVAGFCAGLGGATAAADRWTGEGAEGGGALVGSICEMRSLKRLMRGNR